jgi:multidrug efflux pump subunit AcrA (membrane-fusion protein)
MEDTPVSTENTRKRRVQALVTGAIVGCAAASVVVYFHLKNTRLAGAAPSFVTSTVESVLHSNTVQVTGNIEPAGNEDLGFLSSGEVAAIYVEEGDYVEAGALVAELDDSEQVYELAQLDQDIEKARISGSPGDLELLLLQREVKKSALRKRKLYTPISGTVSEVDITVGELTKSENEINAVVRVIDLSSMKAEVEIDELDVPLVKVGQKVRFRFDALPELDVEGRVSSLPLEARLADEGIAVLDAELRIDRPPAEILPGYSFSAEIVIGDDEKILLFDEDAVIERDGKSMVLVVPGDGGTPHPQEVTTAAYSEGKVRVLSGLAEGDTVVVPAPGSGKPGAGESSSGKKKTSLLEMLGMPGAPGRGGSRERGTREGGASPGGIPPGEAPGATPPGEPGGTPGATVPGGRR